MKYIYILDYFVGGIYEIEEEYDPAYPIEPILDKYGININNCDWYVSDEKLTIKALKPKRI